MLPRVEQIDLMPPLLRAVLRLDAELAAEDSARVAEVAREIADLATQIAKAHTREERVFYCRHGIWSNQRAGHSCADFEGAQT